MARSIAAVYHSITHPACEHARIIQPATDASYDLFVAAVRIGLARTRGVTAGDREAHVRLEDKIDKAGE